MWVHIYAYPSDTARDASWKEKLILPFYFTFLSNALAVFASSLRIFNYIKSDYFKTRVDIMMAANLFITCLVYWALLFPFRKPENVIGWISNMIIHLTTPVLSIVVFVIYHRKLKENNDNLNHWKTGNWDMAFLLGWLIIAFIIYFAMGMNKSSAIYAFMNVANQKWYMSLIYLISIPSLYYFMHVLATYLTKKK